MHGKAGKLLAGSVVVAAGLLTGCASVPAISSISQMDKQELIEANAKAYHARKHTLGGYEQHIKAISERAVEVFDWSDEVDQLVLNRKIKQGMPAWAVYFSWGPPDETRERSNSYSTEYTWQYGRIELGYASKVTWMYFNEDWELSYWSSYADN